MLIHKPSVDLPPSATVLHPRQCSVDLGRLGSIFGLCWPILALLISISDHLGPTCLYLAPTLPQLGSKLA
eukprot:12420903-Karenia_brevis.AAC.1